MKELSEQKFFRLLSEYSQKESAVHDLTAALQELANHLASIAISEQRCHCRANCSGLRGCRSACNASLSH